MKKKILQRCLLGMPVGAAMATLITIMISYSAGDGNFYPVAPELIGYCGNEINAVFWQFVFSMIFGAIWAGTTVIWEVENWSILRQTVTHFFICSFTTLPIAFFMCWIEHGLFSIVTYFVTFVCIYVFIWLSQYLATKRKIDKLNKKIKEENL